MVSTHSNPSSPLTACRRGWLQQPPVDALLGCPAAGKHLQRASGHG